MRTLVTRIIILSFVGFVGFASWFYYKNLRGLAPAFVPAPAVNTTELPLTVPDGFSLSIFAKDIPSARVLVWDPQGRLLVSSPATGNVFSLPEKTIVAERLNKPHGLAVHNGKLYIAETDAVAVYEYDGKETNRKKVIDLPGGGNHFSRTIGFGPDGKLYVSIGSSFNVCVEKDIRRASILVANPDGSDLKVFASGLRNSVFFIWRGSDMWATEMGRDLLGDDLPPDEINIIREGGFYGWPTCYGKQSCDSSVASYIDLQAHSAPLGLAFIPESWGKEYSGDLLVAFHGSWNRSVPTGYKVVRIKLDDAGNYESTEDFITGWLGSAAKPAGALGRPVDLLFDAKGNLFISDDKAGVIYRVSFQTI